MRILKHIALIGLVLLVASITVKAQTNRTIGLFTNTQESFNGYTLFSPMDYTSTYLIDNCGELINEWTSEYIPGLAAYMIEDGRLLRSGYLSDDFYSGAGKGGILEIKTWDDQIEWSVIISNEAYGAHHDIEYLPGGTILFTAWESKDEQEVLNKGRRPGTFRDEMWPTVIYEIAPIGTDSFDIVWEWHLWDHLVQDVSPMIDDFGLIAEHPERVNLNLFDLSFPDWAHINGIDYNPDRDEIILSSWHFNEFWIIDHSTTTAEAAGSEGGNSGKGGDILYRWGNPRNYGMQGADNGQRQLFGQHDVQWIKSAIPGEGNILIFNNADPSGSSSVMEIESIYDENGNYIIEENRAYDLMIFYTRFKEYLILLLSPECKSNPMETYWSVMEMILVFMNMTKEEV